MIALPRTEPHSWRAVAARVRTCDSAVVTAALSVSRVPSAVSICATATTPAPRLRARRAALPETSTRAWAVWSAATAPA